MSAFSLFIICCATTLPLEASVNEFIYCLKTFISELTSFAPSSNPTKNGVNEGMSNQI